MKKSLWNFFLHHFTSILPWCGSQRILLLRSCHIWMAKFTFVKERPYPFHSPILFTINCWLPPKSIEDRGVDMLPPLPYSFPFHQLYLLSEQYGPEKTSVKLNEISKKVEGNHPTDWLQYYGFLCLWVLSGWRGVCYPVIILVILRPLLFLVWYCIL